MSISEEIEGRIDELQRLAQGNPQLIGAIRALAGFGECNARVEHGDIWGGLLLEILDPIIEALGSKDSSFDTRARVLAADVMEIGFDDAGHYEFHDIMRAKHDARRLLTGVDEGPYRGREYEEQERQEQERARQAKDLKPIGPGDF